MQKINYYHKAKMTPCFKTEESFFLYTISCGLSADGNETHQYDEEKHFN